ncbi:hypothetical protein FGO68_gene6674 [Halteria grandinella]|uniref:RING-type domain-containing protein n=1 Tax=Halteria grandinella TaxID=5974 RepID=A0A8J8NUS4_HALGN|nr:hypothetical protein FGO68_gene6674 [Halteria grandinella]
MQFQPNNNRFWQAAPEFQQVPNIDSTQRVRIQHIGNSDKDKERIIRALERLLKRKAYAKSALKETFPNCVICFEDFTPESEVRETPCHHLFHSQCIMSWLKTKLPKADCPNCRQDFVLPQIEE